MTQLTPTLHRTIVVVDVVGFTDPSRNDSARAEMHQGLYQLLGEAFEQSGISLDACTYEDRGDGVLILVPPEFSKSYIADRFPDRILAALRRYNYNRVPAARFKLRVSLNAGDIRHDGNGWIGTPLDNAFRISDAQQAKDALRQTDQMVAFISSDDFYTGVIRDDPASVPDEYVPIPVAVKTFTATAWLRLLGNGGSQVRLPEPALPQFLETAPTISLPAPSTPVRDRGEPEEPLPVMQFDRLSELRVWLRTKQVPRLMVIMSQAVGPAVPLPRRADIHDAWDAFEYLMEFNAGPDGIPPGLLFLRQLADELDEDVAEKVLGWTAEQTRLLRRERAMKRRTEEFTAVADEPHLHLTIMVEPDPIDPGRGVLAYWRQDDPDTWPPPLGGVREVFLTDLEHRVDEVVLEAEQTWSEKDVSVAVEFLLPRTLLHLPVHRWRKEHDSGQPKPLCYDYRLSLRSLERARNKHWHRVWHKRWASMLEDPSAGRVHFSGSAEFEERPIDAVLSDPYWLALVLAETPSPQLEPGAGRDELISALQYGLPVLFWHPEAHPDDIREVVQWVLDGDGGFMEVPARRKLANLSTDMNFDDSLARDLVVLWDDPKRLIVLDQPLTPAKQ